MAHINDKYDFTVSAFVLHPDQPKIFLHMHKKLGKWLQPGGHVELDEDLWQALEHELQEETGLELDKCELLNQPDRPIVVEEGFVNFPIPFQKFVHNFFPDGSHKHSDDTYLLRSYTEDAKPNEDEPQQWNWFTIDELHELHSSGELFDNTLTICEWIAERYFTDM